MSESVKLTEYTEAHNLMRFHLELRAKLLNFAILFNGALLAIVLQHITAHFAKIMLSLFAFSTTVVLLLLTIRSFFLVNSYAEYLEKIERDLGLALITETKSLHRETGFWTRRYFEILYCMFMLLWIFIAYYSK